MGIYETAKEILVAATYSHITSIWYYTSNRQQ